MMETGRPFLQSLIFIMTFSLILLSGQGCSQNRTGQMSSADYVAIGDEYYQGGNYYQALDNFLMAAEIDPENPVHFYKIGLVYGTLHSLEGTEQSVIGGRKNRLSRKLYREDSNYNNAVYYFGKASNMGHLPSRHILRAMHENIQHLDVQY